MRESEMERSFRRWVESQGGMCLKLIPAGRSGFPDRTVLMPDCCAMFVELKIPGGHVRKGQIKWFEKLQQLGHPTLITDNLDEAQEFVLTHTRTT